MLDVAQNLVKVVTDANYMGVATFSCSMGDVWVDRTTDGIQIGFSARRDGA